jgi:hypothetical protein
MNYCITAGPLSLNCTLLFLALQLLLAPKPTLILRIVHGTFQIATVVSLARNRFSVIIASV